jgi:hypothetical protein
MHALKLTIKKIQFDDRMKITQVRQYIKGSQKQVSFHVNNNTARHINIGKYEFWGVKENRCLLTKRSDGLFV